MSDLRDFLDALFRSGKVAFRAPPVAAPAAQPAAVEVLSNAYRSYQLDVAGPPLAFRPECAVAAAELVRHACWYLVHYDDPPQELERRLTLPSPGTPAEHLSADLVLRYLTTVHRRARARAPADPLCLLLTKVLREWPLSGVLTDVVEKPLTPLDFAGHPGLLLLYAERLARNPKPEWLPTGPALEYVELACRDLGQEDPPLLSGAREQAAAEGSAHGDR